MASVHSSIVFLKGFLNSNGKEVGSPAKLSKKVTVEERASITPEGAKVPKVFQKMYLVFQKMYLQGTIELSKQVDICLLQQEEGLNWKQITSQICKNH